MINLLDSLKDWEKIFSNKISEKETIILKTSHRCPISFFAKKQFESWIKNLSDDNNLTIYEIDVIYQRDISNRIAEDTQITHESPQVIWLNKDRSVKFYLNHSSINENNLSKYSEGNKPKKKGLFSSIKNLF